MKQFRNSKSIHKCQLSLKGTWIVKQHEENFSFKDAIFLAGLHFNCECATFPYDKRASAWDLLIPN